MTISGTISNQSGETIPGASVFISDANGVMVNPPRGVNADVNGVYSININPNDHITASYVGTEKRTIKPSGQTVNFILSPPAGGTLKPVEITIKKPFPWILAISGLIVVMGLTFILIDINNKLKLSK